MYSVYFTNVLFIIDNKIKGSVIFLAPLCNYLSVRTHDNLNFNMAREQD